MTLATVSTSGRDPIDRAMLHAVRLAARGHGHVEPNPMVGCVIVDRAGAMIASGFHRRVGGDHAEVEALRRAGDDARGATLVVTLEPCAHHGRTPPCTEAIERAGIARVFFACADPNPVAAGGAAQLLARGIEATLHPHPAATLLNAPFVHRQRTGLPWISVKWAQTIDGAIAARSGQSKWISSDRLRRMVHRERGRVDAVITGIGTALADDPNLTPRGVSQRRMPLRVVVDPTLALPPASTLLRSASKRAPLVIAAPHAALRDAASRVAELQREGVTCVGHDGSLRSMLHTLSKEHGVARALVESGGGLVSALEREGLINESWVVVAPLLAGDAQAPRALRSFEPQDPQSMIRRALVGAWRRNDEMVLLYR